MAKRFTDTEKWNDPWYRKLPVVYKNFWDYLCARCDNSGVWKVDMEMAQFQIDRTVDAGEALKYLAGRVVELTPDYWHIPGFVPFQFGKLSPDSKPHQAVLHLIEKHRNKGYPKGMDTLKDKEKDKDKDKEGSLRGSRFVPPTPDQVAEYAASLGADNFDGNKFCDFYESKGWKVGNTPMKDWKAAVRTWLSKAGEVHGKPDWQ